METVHNVGTQKKTTFTSVDDAVLIRLWRESAGIFPERFMIEMECIRRASVNKKYPVRYFRKVAPFLHSEGITAFFYPATAAYERFGEFLVITNIYASESAGMLHVAGFTPAMRKVSRYKLDLSHIVEVVIKDITL